MTNAKQSSVYNLHFRITQEKIALSRSVAKENSWIVDSDWFNLEKKKKHFRLIDVIDYIKKLKIECLPHSINLW